MDTSTQTILSELHNIFTKIIKQSITHKFYIFGGWAKNARIRPLRKSTSIHYTTGSRIGNLSVTIIRCAFLHNRVSVTIEIGEIQ